MKNRTLLKLTTRDGGAVYLNPDLITAIQRDAIGGTPGSVIAMAGDGDFTWKVQEEPALVAQLFLATNGVGF